MRGQGRDRLAILLLGVLLMASAPVVQAATLYVGDTGVDGRGCGFDLTTPCRSITRAISHASSGDTILVGPGRYGDLDGSGVLGDAPGEELGSAGCDCVLSIDKNVIVISTTGAAVTIVDGRSANVDATVRVRAVGGEFGRPGKGFMVTETARKDSAGDFAGMFTGTGIASSNNSADVKIRGNQVIFTRVSTSRSGAPGIRTSNDASIRIEGNQVMHWWAGILGDGAPIVSKNQVIGAEVGISMTGGMTGAKVLGNVVTANAVGIFWTGPTTVTGNAAYMNAAAGFWRLPSSGVFSRNNLFANDVSDCGLVNEGGDGFSAINNYWGAPSGPGSLPANMACGDTTIESSFATQPFVVKPLKP